MWMCGGMCWSVKQNGPQESNIYSQVQDPNHTVGHYKVPLSQILDLAGKSCPQQTLLPDFILSKCR
jgi:hypothetical protein